QVTALSKDLNSEKNRCAELQKTSDSTKESLTALQSDYYGKESELSAVRQDLKVCEEKLVLAQEELVANRNQLSAHETQIQELKTGRTALEKDLSKRNETIKQHMDDVQKLQKQQ
ncbi:hypothetical protein M9458_036100, partial [Cirrhinus mrigala]